MNALSAQRALTDSAIALLVACAGIAMFLPPMQVTTMSSVLRMVVIGLAIVAAVPLHWVFLAMAARRMGQRALPWVALSVLLFPVGAVAALVLLGWSTRDARPPAQPFTAR